MVVSMSFVEIIKCLLINLLPSQEVSLRSNPNKIKQIKNT